MTAQRSFCFHLSCDINLQVRIRISNLLGELPWFRQTTEHGLSVLGAASVTASLRSACEVLGLETQTTYIEASPTGCVWGEWLTFCVKYRDLPADTLLCLAVWGVCEGGGSPTLVGGTTMPLFSKKGRLKTGTQQAHVWLGRPPCPASPSSTPGKQPLAERGRLGALEHLQAAYMRGDLPAISWLDTLSFAAIQELQHQAHLHQPQGHLQLQPSQPTVAVAQAAGDERATASRVQREAADLLLVLDLPYFPHAVLYQQHGSSTAAGGVAGIGPMATQGTASSTGGASGSEAGSALGLAARARFWNTRGAEPGSGPQPATVDRSVVEGIVVLEDAEVGRDNPAELKAQKLARSLTRGVIDKDLKPNSEEKKALGLIIKLPPNKPLHAEERALLWRFRFSLQHETRALTKFLQCVDWSDAGEARQAADLMVGWAHIHTADALELLSPSFKSEEVRGHAVSVLQQKDDEELLSFLLQLVQALRYERSDASRLSRFLVSRALANPHFAIMLHWYLFTELDDPGFGHRASAVHAQLTQSLQQARPSTKAPGSGKRQVDCSKVYDVIVKQSKLLSQLHFAIRELKGGRYKAARATARLQVRCCMIYKKGDDLRQDQFILQMIGLMDRLLKRESLDLRLTPYKVLPTSADDGLVEYVQSVPLSKVLADHRTIHKFLALSASDASGPFGLRHDVVETFVRSAAGYCVVTYLLGVGDRHLDNLLLCSDGRLFHIDFGFILGSDPKPFPPPMKICKEMVEAMGGADNVWYGTFRMYACEAYNILRKNADLILSLFHLMAGASIEAIRIDPEKALLKLQDKFRLDLDDEAAMGWMQMLLNESATALIPQIVETTHRWAQYWR
ncbi:putative phosphatidylinositol 3-kinase [Haematococcus lacustris]